MKTANQYFEEVPEQRRETMNDVRQMIKSLVPEISETMDYRMPTYVIDNRILFALANQKNYQAFYVIPYDLLAPLEQDINVFNHGKSCIRFTRLTEEKKGVIEKVIKYVAENHSKSIYYGKYLSH
jgi:uncharacterized protein YdhG (YjbR/CyaY superfamily)